LQVYWCREVEECLNEKEGVVEGKLVEFLQVNIERLEELSILVRGDLGTLDRKVLCALITIDVHARDIVDILHRYVSKNIDLIYFEYIIHYILCSLYMILNLINRM